MPTSNDFSESLQERVREAAGRREPLAIVGGGTKAFYGRPASGTPLNVGGHRGLVEYAPEELVISARAGTPLLELEAVLAEQGQMFGFEPPYFGPHATLGGTVACGLSGPARPYLGAVRDFVLGVSCLNGKGEILRFGGTVMKNVAGYDVSRLMTGALGTLGVLLEISVKVLPRPRAQTTLVFETTASEAITRLARWAGRPLPITAACHVHGRLHVRLAGAATAVTAARTQLGGEEVTHGLRFWRELREQTHPFFAGNHPLWRLSVPAQAPLAELGGDWLLDWGGAQRWLRTDQPGAAVRNAAAGSGGHATLFRGSADREAAFTPLTPALHMIHRRLKTAFDPAGILNPGRWYPDL